MKIILDDKIESKKKKNMEILLQLLPTPNIFDYCIWKLMFMRKFINGR